MNAKNRRSGFTLTELMVCASMLVTIMSLVASMSLRANRLWHDTRQQKIALDELTNQMEYLTTLDVAEARQALNELEISPAISQALPSATLTGELIEQPPLIQIVLTLEIDADTSSAPSRHHPLQLVGFLSSESDNDAVETEDES